MRKINTALALVAATVIGLATAASAAPADFDADPEGTFQTLINENGPVLVGMVVLAITISVGISLLKSGGRKVEKLTSKV